VTGLAIEEVKKVYDDDTVAVQDMSMDIEDGEFIVFVGPSGCGKSTALRMIAGLEDITEGKIYIGDQVVNDVAPGDRNVAMVFQNYALFPHMKVRDNIAFGLQIRKESKDDIQRRVEEVARVLSIEPLLDRRPRALSGGQRQRVALGRAIIREPNAFLMDEPLSNLDAKLRGEMRTELSKLHNQLGTTTIYVTHDQTEAMTMADRIVLLKDGVIQQMATLQEMYDHPRNVFVAGFIGSPAMNFMRARIEKEGSGLVAVFGEARIPISGELPHNAEGQSYVGGDVILGIRPEHLEDVRLAKNPEKQAIIEVETQVIESMGSEKYLYCELSEEQVAHTQSMGEVQADIGSDEEAAEMMVARVAPETEAREDDSISLVIDSSKVHLFDPETEEAIL
jgi:multiple sugar transport system ATP-binding protein